MPLKTTNDEGLEIEVYTADEVKAQSEAAVKTAVEAKDKEFGTVKSGLESKLTDAEKALKDRAGEFKEFRKLNEDTVAKMTVMERTMYENTLKLKESDDARIASEKKTRDTLVENSIKAKAGNNEKLITKMKDMYALIGIDANTQEEIDRKVLAVMGAISTTEPDLIATVNGFTGGSYVPPTQQQNGDKSFADTDKGKAGAAEIGLVIEAPKK